MLEPKKDFKLRLPARVIEELKAIAGERGIRSANRLAARVLNRYCRRWQYEKAICSQNKGK